MIDQALIEKLKKGVNQQIGRVLGDPMLNKVPELRAMLEYAMGMDGVPGSDVAQGKRLRPMLLLLSAHAVGGKWENALSAAAAVELMHNFSLIHDDIQDQSELRRGRPTVWVKWGTAQAINAGDAMLGLAQLALLQDAEMLTDQNATQLFRSFNRTLVELTTGQYLDLSFEDRGGIGIREYDQMVAGKTGALMAACFGMGAILGEAEGSVSQKMTDAGRAAGRAFQIQDDWLGIWGNEGETGKSARSDLIEKKKTFPVILGLEARGDFARLWHQLEKIEKHDADRLAELLVKDGIKGETEKAFSLEYERAITDLHGLSLESERLQPLMELIQSILGRMK